MPNTLGRRDFLYTTVAGTAGALALGGSEGLLAQAAAGQASSADRDAVVAKIAPQHAATVKMLQDWIAFPSIAAENLNFPKGAEYMAQLARDAGFTKVEVIKTAG